MNKFKTGKDVDEATQAAAAAILAFAAKRCPGIFRPYADELAKASMETASPELVVVALQSLAALTTAHVESAPTEK